MRAYASWLRRCSAAVLAVLGLVAGLGASAPGALGAAGEGPYRLLGHGSYDVAWAVAAGPGGDVYVAGYTSSPGFATPGAAQPDYGGGEHDAFLLRLAADGQLVYSTYLGGTDEDRAYGLAVDDAGNAYVTGYTHSADFPVRGGAQPALAGAKDAFVVKVDPAGRRVLYGTFLGGADRDQGRAVALDGSGGVWVVGSTHSADFPAPRGRRQAARGDEDAFIARLAPDGRSFPVISLVGGTGGELGYGVAAGQNGTWLVGYTDSADLPVRRAAQATARGGNDAFIARVDGGGSVTILTYLGGDGEDRAWGVAAGADGDAWVTGYTESADFPVLRPLQAHLAGGRDAFVAHLDPRGKLLASTFLGGTDTDHAFAVALPARGGPIVSGYTRSPDFPLPAPAAARADDPFVVRLAPDGGRVTAGRLQGGAEEDRAYAVAVDGDGRPVLAGYTYSRDAGERVPGLGAPGGRDVLVGRLAPDLARVAWRRLIAGRGAGPGAVPAEQVAAGLVRWPELSHQGGVLFQAPLGVGDAPTATTRAPAVPAARFRRVGGPEALACVSCHGALTTPEGLVRLAPGGAGDVAANAFVAGTGSAGPVLERNPRAVFGAAVKDALAREMTAQMQAGVATAKARARATGRPVAAEVVAKGVSFGRVAAQPDGRVDTRGVTGIDADLVVRPFGAKGTLRDLPAAIAAAARAHLPVPAAVPAAAPGAGRLSDGDTLALVAWIADRPLPRRSTPSGRQGQAQVAHGEALFTQLGCADCHVPELVLSQSTLRLGPAATLDLAGQGLMVRPGDGMAVALYSDLRRHDLGPDLAEATGQGDVGAAEFLTPPLWGVAATGPWLHDGRATSLADAILWHGGAAATARGRFAALAPDDQSALVAFLETLDIDLAPGLGDPSESGE